MEQSMHPPHATQDTDLVESVLAADLASAGASRTSKEQFLSIMDTTVPWDELCARVEPYYPWGQGGAFVVPLERVLRMYMLGRWFGLSALETEEETRTNMAFLRFLGLAPDEAAQVPDAATLYGFGALLDKHDLATQLLDYVNVGQDLNDCLLRDREQAWHK